MNTLKDIEVAGRKAWLAGIGVYGTGWKYAINKFDETYVKTNELLSDFIVEGEKIEKNIQKQLKSKVMIEARVNELKEKLGLNEASEADRLDALSLKVDNLTAKVTALVKTKEAQLAAPQKKPAVKKAPAKKATKATTK